MPVLTDILGSVDEILEIRQNIGAELKEVFFVERTWSGAEARDGTFSDVKTKMEPLPRVVEFFDDYRIREGGAIQQGDIMLKMVSKESFPQRSQIDCSSSDESVQKYYEVGGALYRVIMVREKHVTWDIQLRKTSDQGA